MNLIAFCIYDTPDGKVGGPIAWAMDIVPFLNQSVEPVIAFVLRPGGGNGSNVVATLLAQNVQCDALDTSNCCHLEEQIEWIYSRCRKWRPRIVIANLVLPALYAARGLRKASILTIGVMHSHPEHDPFYSDFVEVFTRRSSRYHVDHVVCVSHQIASQLGKNKADTVEVSVIPCGAKEASRTACQESNQVKMLYAGRLVQYAKRIRETTESLISACNAYGFKAAVIGDGIERTWIEERLKNNHHVSYEGTVPQSRIQEVYSSHQVIVLLSDFEGLPIALVEAMACGLIPIGLRDAPGVSEVIQDGVNGLLVSDRDEGFVRAVGQLQDPYVRKKLSCNAMKTIEVSYSHKVTFSRWRLLLSEPNKSPARYKLIPYRMAVKDRYDRFVGYPNCRATCFNRVCNQVKSLWASIRRFIRPRARARKLVQRLRYLINNES